MKPFVFPPKLVDGDEVRVIAPSDTLWGFSRDNLLRAQRALEAQGLRVTYGAHAFVSGPLGAAPAAARAQDLNDAFAEENVKCVLCAFGGFLAVELLPLLDYKSIARHPKILLGYSDITALLCGIQAKTGLVTYHGPNFSEFAMERGFEYTLEQFIRCLGCPEPYDLWTSGAWSYDTWWYDQQNRHWNDNPGPVVLSEGVAEGPILGTNLCTLNLLQGTAYMPTLAGRLLFLEDDGSTGERFGVEFLRNLVSLSLCPGFDRCLGLALGRCCPETNGDAALMAEIVSRIPALAGKPIAYGFDFGHTSPLACFAIGGTARLDCSGERPAVTFLTH